jgi:hypothetical protein
MMSGVMEGLVAHGLVLLTDIIMSARMFFFPLEYLYADSVAKAGAKYPFRRCSYLARRQRP